MSNDALLEAILAAPDDDAPRLVWADREGGERGELVVLQCELARRARATADHLKRAQRRRMVRRERELLDKHSIAWANVNDTLASQFTFVRGFVEGAWVAIAPIAKPDGVEELFAKMPLLRELSIQSSGTVNGDPGNSPDREWAVVADLFRAAFDQITRHPFRVRSLSARPTISEFDEHTNLGTEYPYGDAFAELVANTEAFRSDLEALTIRSGAVSNKGAGLLAASLRSLNELCVYCTLDAAGVVDLLHQTPTLTRLRLQYSNLSSETIRALLDSPDLLRLTELNLSGNRLDDVDLVRIATTPALRNLDTLNVGYADHAIGSATFEAIAHSPHLSGVRDLTLVNMATDEAVRTLADATFAKTLRRMSLAGGSFTERSVAPLLESFPLLEYLDISFATSLSRDAIRKLDAVLPEVRAISLPR